ncbi:MAG: S9 family peptidase [Chloroflexi bacterium]|nr:S9 family peptidase [Chloroflexota bacterium]
MSAENRWAVEKSVLLLAKVGRCWSPSFSPDGQELAFVSDLTGSPQVWRIALSRGFPEAVTAFDEQVNAVLWSPAGDWLAVESAPGGGMNAQIDLLRPDGSDRRRLTKGQATNNWLNVWTKDGRYLLFSSNMDQSDSMDSFRICVESGAAEKLAKNSGTGVIEDVTIDGGRVLVKRIVYRGDNNVHLVDMFENQERLLTPHDPPASFENARFSADGRHVYLVSNRDRDLAYLGRLSQGEDEHGRVLRARDDAELVEFAISPSDKSAAIVWNIAGRHELELINLPAADKQCEIDLPGEIVEDLRFSSDGSQLAMCVSGSRLPQDIWVLDIATLSLRQLTRSPRIGVQLERLGAPRLLRYSAHDGLPLTGWLYTPPDVDAPFPTVFSFHGGPEGQEQPRFRYDYQALLSEGIAVFAPNVRGSSGFGKRFVNLDNGALRFDAIQDIASTVHYLIGAGIAEAGKLGIMGGSYGGYMTMAGLAEFPELFAAGVNLYGLVNFKTFFERTEPWMASISKIEYGDPDTEGDLLDALSPIHKLGRVAAPTLVIHGANDTNVPVYEAEQVVEELRMRNVPVEYILFPDEGHGFRKEQNRIKSVSAIVAWFTKYLLSS